MTIRSFSCPHCGKSLQFDENSPISFCPYCAGKLDLTGNRKTDSNNAEIRKFISDEGVALASAYIPKNYNISTYYETSWRSEMVPVYYSLKATRNDNHVFIGYYSKELFHKIKNPFLKGMLKLSDVHVKSGYQKLIEPEEYLIKEANRIAGVPLTLVAQTKLPSPLGKNKQLALDLPENDIKDFASFVEIQPERVSRYVDSLLYRFEGYFSKQKVVVLAGMDYEGAELAYTKPVFSGLISKIKDNVNSDVSFGHSNKHVDHILYGVQNLYFCTSFEEDQEDAQFDFLNFINSIVEDSSLDNIKESMYNAKFRKVAAQIARNQAITRQNLRNLQMNQQRLAQTLRDNANSMSDGLMDSWNKKMESDSRLSEARSQATMGVDTYTNSYGQNVDVSVTADHVYENQYGDVYGVSGNEVDQDVLNKLNWKKIDK